MTPAEVRDAMEASRVVPDDLEPGIIENAALLHVTGIARARAAGVPVSFDVNQRASLWAGRDPAPLYRETAASADLLKASEGVHPLTRVRSTRVPHGARGSRPLERGQRTDPPDAHDRTIAAVVRGQEEGTRTPTTGLTPNSH